MFPSFSFVYQSFIPQSVGRPLSEIFRSHPHFNRQDLINYDSFVASLQEADALGRIQRSGGNWIAEPPPFSTVKGTYAMTNDGEFEAAGSARRHTTNKVRIEGNIDLREVGRMSAVSPPIRVPPTVEAYQCRADIVPQMSSLNVGYPGIQVTTGRYVGVYTKPEQKISHISGRVHVENKIEGSYFTRPGISAHDLFDTTILIAKAAGSYPFVPVLAPDIDMTLTVKLHRRGDQVEVQFEGLHDQFPAYELLINDVRVRRWDPVANHQFGPNPVNLNANYLRTQVRTSYAHYERLPLGYTAPRRAAWPGGF